MDIVTIWILSGVITAFVASYKRRSGCGWFVLGALLGPFGLILSLVVPSNAARIEREAILSGAYKQCPYCAELIRTEAVKCPHCRSEVDSPADTEPTD